MLQSKNVPLALFSLFCLKALVTGLSLETVACIASLGIISFLYETFIQNKLVRKLEKELSESLAKEKENTEYFKREIEQLKSYVSSQKLNSVRGSSGFNRTA
jgi:hypothetical protein